MGELLGTFTPDNLIGGDKKLVTEDILVAAGQNLSRGSVLGRTKVSVPTTGTLAGTGNGTCTSVVGGSKTIPGAYLVTCTVLPVTHGGTFKVTNPNGLLLGEFTMPDTAGGTFDFKSDEISFTLTDGGTNFDLTSIFTITVTEGVPNVGTAGANTGNGTVTLVEGRRYLKVGIYTLTCTAAVTHGGTFSVVDPDGNSLPDAVMTPGAGGTTAIENDQIAFTITDGGTDFVVGDSFTITVTVDPRQAVLLSKAATDGSSVPYCVLSEDVDASIAAKRSIGYLEGQFNERQLIFASGTDIEDVRDAMREVGLIPVASQIAGSVNG